MHSQRHFTAFKFDTRKNHSNWRNCQHVELLFSFAELLASSFISMTYPLDLRHFIFMQTTSLTWKGLSTHKGQVTMKRLAGVMGGGVNHYCLNRACLTREINRDRAFTVSGFKTGIRMFDFEQQYFMHPSRSEKVEIS